MKRKHCLICDVPLVRKQGCVCCPRCNAIICIPNQQHEEVLKVAEEELKPGQLVCATFKDGSSLTGYVDEDCYYLVVSTWSFRIGFLREDRSECVEIKVLRDPKPPEPMLKWAIVEDREGLRWKRHGTGNGYPAGYWHCETGIGVASWGDFDAVRVIFAGIE